MSSCFPAIISTATLSESSRICDKVGSKAVFMDFELDGHIKKYYYRILCPFEYNCYNRAAVKLFIEKLTGSSDLWTVCLCALSTIWKLE